MKNSITRLAPYVITGNEHIDNRGKLCFINGFDMTPIKRMYTIEHPSTSVIRAWQAHNIESKYFKCLKGRFIVAAVAIDDWDNPSPVLQPKTFILEARTNEVLCIPGGHANGFKALDPESQLLVFSDMDLDSAKDDQFKFDPHLWMDWNNY